MEAIYFDIHIIIHTFHIMCVCQHKVREHFILNQGLHKFGVHRACKHMQVFRHRMQLNLNLRIKIFEGMEYFTSIFQNVVVAKVQSKAVSGIGPS